MGLRGMVRSALHRINIRGRRDDEGFLTGRDLEITDAAGAKIPGLITKLEIVAGPDEPVVAHIEYVLSGAIDVQDVAAQFWPADELALRTAAVRLGYDIILVKRDIPE
jgi:hypothetical protein